VPASSLAVSTVREAAEMFENKPGVVTTASFAWHPSDAFKRGINWSAFLAAENVASYALLERRAASNPEWFWDALIRFLGLKFIKPYSRVLDQTRSRIR
jgi:hypothetical protein